jgi:hypothetical protein
VDPGDETAATQEIQMHSQETSIKRERRRYGFERSGLSIDCSNLIMFGYSGIVVGFGGMIVLLLLR